MIRPGVRIFGDIYKDIQNYNLRTARAMTMGTREAGRGLKMALRQQVRLGGLGPKVEKTWQDMEYPKGGEYSLSPAHIVFSKAPKLIEAYDRGVTIRAKKGLFLAIPTDDTPVMRMRGAARVKVTPKNWPESKYGKLRFVAGKQGYAFLVVDDLRKSFSKKDKKFRGYRRASDSWIRKGQKTESVIMFILIPQARVRKRLDVEREYRKFAAAHMDFIKARMDRGN